jgi:hypothetical protein
MPKESSDAADFAKNWIDRLSRSYLSVNSEAEGGPKRARPLQTTQVAKLFEGTFSKLASKDDRK